MFEQRPDTQTLIDLIREVVPVERGALKQLHPLANDVDANVALERMKREISVLQTTKHDALPRVLEANIEERWFVMEFCSRGALNQDLDRTKGMVLPTLVRLRPIVEATSLLHAKGLVHRDIKPKNLFVREDVGLVLGDLGLVVPVGDDARVTETYANPGSRDWMPGWVMGKTRIEDIRPNVDVFALGKVLWCMVSGERGLTLWYHDKPEHELSKRFPDNHQIPWITAILNKTVRENEGDCLADAGLLLKEIDSAIEALHRGAQHLSTEKSHAHRCWVCGIGRYRPAPAPGPVTRRVACEHCGHIQDFAWRDKPAWESSEPH